MSEIRNILFLGASYAGLGASHYFLKHVYPHLPNDSNVTYKAIIVDPSSKWYSRPVAPRVAASPDLISIDQAFFDTESGYSQYGDKIQFVQGKAVSWDEKSRSVTVEKADRSIESIPYWALILATGSKSTSPIFSLQGMTHTDVQAALHSLHDQLATARDIVIAGGGPTAVETAGELGDALNGAAGWCSSRPSNPKAKITVLTNSSKVLPGLRQSISDQAEVYLNRVGVDVRYNVKVASTSDLASGKTKIILHDGEELFPDIYIPAMGVKPMSEYVPEHLKDKKGYVIMNESTLRVDGAGPRVYALGDAGSYSRNSVMDIMFSLPVMETNLKRDLLAAHSDANAKPEGKDRLYVKNEKETQVVPVGRSKGVGAAFGWRLPSIMVWMIKGRDFMISSALGQVDGTAQAKESVWKQ